MDQERILKKFRFGSEKLQAIDVIMDNNISANSSVSDCLIFFNNLIKAVPDINSLEPWRLKVLADLSNFDDFLEVALESQFLFDDEFKLYIQNRFSSCFEGINFVFRDYDKNCLMCGDYYGFEYDIDNHKKNNIFFPHEIRSLLITSQNYDEVHDFDSLPENLNRLMLLRVAFKDYNKLPVNLKTLEFYHLRNMILNELPENLESLKLHECHDASLDLICLPRNLKSLFINTSYAIKTLYGIPEGLESLYLSSGQFNTYEELNKIPSGLQCLKLHFSKYKDLDDLCFLYSKLQDLKSLDISLTRYTCDVLRGLPEGLKSLNIRHLNESTLIDLNCWPKDLENLGLEFCFKLTNLEGLPIGLKNLKIESCFELTSLEGLPIGLKNLKIESCFELTSLEGVPEGLENLEIDEYSRRNLDEESLKMLEKFGV